MIIAWTEGRRQDHKWRVPLFFAETITQAQEKLDKLREMAKARGRPNPMYKHVWIADVSEEIEKLT